MRNTLGRRQDNGITWERFRRPGAAHPGSPGSESGDRLSESEGC